MPIPTKVIIECTADGYSTKVLAGDLIISDRAWVMESAGMAISKEPDDIVADLRDPEFEAEEFFDLAEAVQDAGMEAFEISSNLYRLREDWA